MKNFQWRTDPQWGLGLLFLLTLVLAAAALAPGLDGTFFVDDYGNLEGLDRLNASPSLHSGLHFALSGVSSELGRPLALATFALQHDSWPDAPGDFIYVNVATHLLSACLLFWCFLKILELAPGAKATSGFVALGATACWMFASLQTGAVLYVVQRMALLSTLLMLLGLLLYLAGRQREVAGQRGSGLLLMAAGTFVGMPLGILAKENAALFPIVVLSLEYTLLQDVPRSRVWRWLSLPMLWLPSLLIAGYVLSFIPNFEASGRAFSLSERLLTESRILFMYLQRFLLPPLYGLRLYYDDYPLSKSLLQPWTTLASVMGWATLIGLAFALRRRAPVFSFAVLWFLANHLIESTVVPLEIAFDHRNYLALAGPAFALAWYARKALTSPVTQRVRPALVASVAAYAAFVVFSFWQAAASWGQPWHLVYFWGQEQPDSRRAQDTLAKYYWHAHLPQQAIDAEENALKRWPGDASFFFGILKVTCAFPDLPKPDLRRLESITAAYDSTAPAIVGPLDVLVGDAELGQCKRYSPAELWSMVEMSFDTPKLAPHEQNHKLLLSRIAELANDRALSRRLLDQAIRFGPPTPVILQQAVAWSVAARDLECARSYLAQFSAGQQMKLFERWGYGDEIASLAAAVEQLAAAPGAGPVPGGPDCRHVDRKNS